MNTYSIEYDSHSVFLRNKANDTLNQRLENIRTRKNLFLPSINVINNNKSKSPSKSPSPKNSKKHISVMDYGKFDINSRKNV
jgi:hypothetical protein